MENSAEQKILFIKRDAVLRQARELASKDVLLDEASQVYAFYDRSHRRVVTFGLQEAFVPYDRAVDLRPQPARNLNDPRVLAGMRN